MSATLWLTEIKLPKKGETYIKAKPLTEKEKFCQEWREMQKLFRRETNGKTN